MHFKETEIQDYIWQHSEDLFDMIQTPRFEADPNKKPWEYEPWELLYYQTLKEYEESYKSLERLEIFGCEVRLEKEGESTIRTDFMGCLEGENGLVICELKVNRKPEREAYTELFAYANHLRGHFSPMGRRDVFYLLISPMEERIVREATISNLLYDRNRILALIPEVGDSIDTLKLKLWIPKKEEFNVFAKTAFAIENIDVFKICWKGAEGKWSPEEEGEEPNSEMIHNLNKVSHYAAQIMEANGINGFVFCSQSYPEVRDAGFLENGLTICGVNPFKSAKTRFLFDLGCDLKEAAKASMESVKIKDFIPSLKENYKETDYDDYCYLMAEAWSSCLDEIGFDVIKRVNQTLGKAYFDKDKGTFTWDSYLNNSAEDVLCWNYDISLTGIFREIYDLKLERHYKAFDQYSLEEKCAAIDSGQLERHIIDMMYSHYHIRDFIKGLIGI